jgi:hypothetical protein
MSSYLYEIYVTSMIRCKIVGGIQLPMCQCYRLVQTQWRFSYQNSTTKVGFIILCNVGHIPVLSTTHPHVIF